MPCAWSPDLAAARGAKARLSFASSSPPAGRPDGTHDPTAPNFPPRKVGATVRSATQPPTNTEFARLPSDKEGVTGATENTGCAGIKCDESQEIKRGSESANFQGYCARGSGEGCRRSRAGPLVTGGRRAPAAGAVCAGLPGRIGPGSARRPGQSRRTGRAPVHPIPRPRCPGSAVVGGWSLLAPVGAQVSIRPSGPVGPS